MSDTSLAILETLRIFLRRSYRFRIHQAFPKMWLCTIPISQSRASLDIDRRLLTSHFALKIGRDNSSADADFGCSAFHRIAAVMRVRPLG